MESAADEQNTKTAELNAPGSRRYETRANVNIVMSRAEIPLIPENRRLCLATPHRLEYSSVARLSTRRPYLEAAGLD